MDDPLLNAMMSYPSTMHLEDSAAQPGDEEREILKLSALPGGIWCMEEKLDGANSGFRFDAAGDPWGQSRGHYLDLRDRSVFPERHFNLFKDWLLVHRDILLERFEDRFIVFGEWMGVTHSIFYDALPHYFLEFDIWDRAQDAFLDTPTRRKLCEGLPFVSVPVLHYGRMLDLPTIKALVRPSLFATGRDECRANLERACGLVGDDFSRRLPRMDSSGLGEGVYGKIERDGRVVARFKSVRPGFRQTILEADEHWQSRFPIPNLLEGQIDVFPAHLGRVPEVLDFRYDPDSPAGWRSVVEATPVPR